MGKRQKEVATLLKFVDLWQKGKQDEIKSVLPQGFSETWTYGTGGGGSL